MKTIMVDTVTNEWVQTWDDEFVQELDDCLSEQGDGWTGLDCD